MVASAKGLRAMAKKATKKAAKKAGSFKSAGKSAAKKAAGGKAVAAKKPAKAKSSSAKKPAKAAAPATPVSNPEPISTGTGASPMDIGQALVAMFNEGKFKEIEDAYWAADITSVEGMGVNLAWHGQEKVHAKNSEWMADHVLHGASAEGPYVGSSGFAVKFRMDVETKSTGQRQVMEEVGVYTVRNGKIAREEFMYFVPRM